MMLSVFADRATLSENCVRRIGTMALLGDMPLINLPFKKVVIDLVGP